MSLAHVLLRQCGKPTGWLGRLTLWRMNRSHSKLTEWGLGQLPIGKAEAILDIGCGGGATIARLAALATDGKVYGVDYSEDSVAASRATNERLIAAGRVEISQASVSELPFADDRFDVVIAVETHYYWPHLESDVAETLRVLKPGGTFALIAEAYKGGKYDRLLQRLDMLQQRGIMNFALLTASEHNALLSAAGYSDVEVVEQYEKGWLCATGRKGR